MSKPGPDAFARLLQQLNRARLQAQRSAGAGGGGGSGGNPFDKIPGGGKGALTGGVGIALLALGGLTLNYSLYNGAW